MIPIAATPAVSLWKHIAALKPTIAVNPVADTIQTTKRIKSKTLSTISYMF